MFNESRIYISTFAKNERLYLFSELCNYDFTRFNVENDFWVDALLTGTVKYKSNNNSIFEKVVKILV